MSKNQKNKSIQEAENRIDEELTKKRYQLMVDTEYEANKGKSSAKCAREKINLDLHILNIDKKQSIQINYFLYLPLLELYL